MREAIRTWPLGALWLALASTTSTGADEPLADLVMRDHQKAISQRVSRFVEDVHYSRPRIDNSLSSAIFDRYLDSFDGNRLYFLHSDYTSLGRYRYELDDRVRSGELQPVFEIFNLWRNRNRERLGHALELLEEEPDFSVDEWYRFDRTDLGWAQTDAEIREIWRKQVKHEGLSLMMAKNLSWDKAADELRTSYERRLRRTAQMNADDVFERFLNAVTHTIDPHSSYLTPRNSEEQRIHMSLLYDGIGATLELDDFDYVNIKNLIAGGPAEIDGRLKRDDRITAVGQGASGEMVSVIGWRLDEVVQLIRGPGGTVVRLQILPAGAVPGSPEVMVDIVRDKVKMEGRAAKSRIIEVPGENATRQIGVIEVPSFYLDSAARNRGEDDYTSTTRDVERLVNELIDENIDGLIVDLRQNGGGHLSEAAELSGLFIERGPLVQLRETRGNVEVLNDPIPGAIYDGPLAVLVDRHSASASEIFAAAIQDYQRGLVIGQQTYGKGSVQNLFDLDRFIRGSEDYGQLTLTIGKYYRVTGESTQHRGVIPDIELPSPWDVENVGESTRETALPWDRIQRTPFSVSREGPASVEVLRTRQNERALGDPDFNYMISSIEVQRSLSDRKIVSLNLEQRKAEFEDRNQERLQLENERRAGLGLEPLADLEELDDEERPDILLDQATRIVADMAALDRPTPPPSSFTGVETVRAN